jgi:hypothetical protein
LAVIVGDIWLARRLELLQRSPNLSITVLNEFLVAAIGCQRLSQSEYVFGPVITNQRFGDDRFARLDALVAQFCQDIRVSLSRQDSLDNGKSGLSRDVADDVMQLQVHLIQRLLHVVDVGRRHLHQAFAVPEQGSYRADFLFRPIRRTQ